MRHGIKRAWSREEEVSLALLVAWKMSVSGIPVVGCRCEVRPGIVLS